MRIGYVVKRYPRFSETFIVNEILAHERAGVPVHIFAVRRVNEAYFQAVIGQVRSPVSYVSDSAPRAERLWSALWDGARELPDFWQTLESFRDDEMADVLQAIDLARMVRAQGITHLHAHFATIACTVAWMASRLAKVGYSVTTHAKDIFHADVDSAALRRRLEHATRVVTVSDFNVDYLQRHHGIAPQKIARIYNGLSLEEFPFSPPGERSRHIVAVGRLVEKKGFGTLIDACALLRDRGVAFSCEIIGEGPQRPVLEAGLAGHGLAGHVRLAGALPRAEVVAALRSASVSALPCIVAEDGDRDGLPTVLLEAMALGTPCVSTDVTGIPELVRHDDTGFCVAQGDHAALAEALARMLDDRALRERVARSARQLIEERFDVARNAAQLRSLFTA